jgi:GAF domain-containing protein
MWPILLQGVLSLEDSNKKSESSEVSGALFADESLGILLTKVQALETFLNLATRDTGFSEFMRELLVVFVKAVPSEAGSILEMNEEEATLSFRAAVGQSSENVQNFVIPVGHGIVGHSIESKQPVVVNQASENQVHLKSIAKAVGFDTRNLIVVPILIRGRVYGALELLNRTGEEAFSDGDTELLTYLVEAASRAIEMRLMIAWVKKAKG